MRVVIDMPDNEAPKRGDLLQTNVGNRRERTCFVVKVHEIKAGRYRLSAVRWWEIGPEFRRLLFRHAERAGGQNVIRFKRYPTKKRKLTFEEYMRRTQCSSL